MKPKAPPVSANSTLAEGQWVEGELLRGLMRTARTTQFVGLLLIPVFVGVLWTDVTREALGAWVAASILMAALRLGVMHLYQRKVMDASVDRHREFFNRFRLLWPCSALVWGSTTLLYFDRSPLADQFICWLILAGVAMFAINSLSAHLQTMRAYLRALALTALVVMAWRIGIDLRFTGPAFHYWLIVLLLIFWHVLDQAGLRLHETHRKNFELQFRNNQLIDSLTRQTQAALDAVNTKNRFLASAAHDIRQPVHALGLYADWLGSEPELVHEIAPKIVESTKAVNALFDALFDLVRLDSGKIRLNIEPVDLGKLLRDLELQYRPLAQARGLQLRVRAAVGTAVSDPILLQRILGNMISNAVKYTQRGGILVACRGTAHGPRVEIWDTGIGIAPVHQREIFREFYKVPGHTGTEDGFGLGLHIVKRLTHILGHPLSLASRPGRGTVFRLMLTPTDPEQAVQRAAPAAVQLASMP